MNRKSMFMPLAAALALTVALMWLLSLSGIGLLVARAAGYTVCPAGPPTCDHNSVQSAVDSAGAGDVIKVATGTYTDINNRFGHAQMVYLDKSVTIRGGYTTANWTTSDPDANPTTLDAQGGGRVLYITGNISPTIEGLRITGGEADSGGGVLIYDSDNVTLTENTISNNIVAEAGGGLVIDQSQATLNNNTISGNHAGWGGGLSTYQAEVVISNNSISDNSADLWGGGVIFTQGDVTFNNNTVSGNVAGANGGGLNLDGNAAMISGNTIVSNTATGLGGGLFLGNSSDASFINNLIADNQADWQGSGLYIGGGSSSLVHTTITRNTGGDGSGLHIGSGTTVAMTNNILVSQTVGLLADPGSTATLEVTLWGSGVWANGTDWDGGGTVDTTVNLWGDPDFIDPGAGDYHIGISSDAIDQGVDAGVTNDIDFQPRPYQAPDIGADEYWPPGALKFIYLPLVMR